MHFCPGASWSRSVCRPGRPLQGRPLRSQDSIQLQRLDGFHSVRSCQAACCQSPACDAFWLTGKMCIQVNCMQSHWCKTVLTHTTHSKHSSILVFVAKPEHPVDFLPASDDRIPLPRWLDGNKEHQSKARLRRSFQEPPAQRAHVVHHSHKYLGTGVENRRFELFPTLPSLFILIFSSKVIKKLAVSAGDSVQVTLPKNEVELNAYVLPPPPKGTSYSYDWRLITHPTDYSGEMEGQHSRILKLSKLTVGLYEFNVIVDGDNAHGEGMVNVTVKPEPRVNQPPVAIASPQFLEISLPTTSTVIDGSQSTDDDKIVSYHWEELKGPLREEKVSADTAILTLTNLVPGNYTFSLTVVDSDGASNSTTASLTVNKAVDYPPVANAGPNQVITLPQNSITLYGNQSTDDHGIVSYEWSLSPNSKGKVVEMQGVRTSTLQLSAMREGDYTYQLTVTDSAGHQSTAEVTVIVQPENNKPPKADAGPDKELTLPVDSTTLDGSKSSDDQKITTYLWEKTRGPDGVKLENANSSIATVTGLEVGTYEFTLTVRDERNLQSRSSVNVIVKEEINKPPMAKVAGNVIITLPRNTAELDGSRSTDDKGITTFLWTRDESSPAAGEVLNNSDHHAVLFLSNLVEGMYKFHLKVTDAKGESDVARATVEVKPDPRKNSLVEMILDVNVSQLTERQKGMFIRQIGVLLGVLDSDITVQKIQPYTEQSTKMVFYVWNQSPHQVLKGHDVARTLKSELRKQQSAFLIFRALEINTVTCQLNCSEHGHCNSFTKRCVCDPFWMENFLRVQLGDGESNCEWSVLYVVIALFVIVVSFGIFFWVVVCCCRRRKGKPKRKSKYKILDATDQESLELKPNPKAGNKQKSQAQNTSLMHSESELDSDEAIFTWPDREKGKLLHNQNGFLRNGQATPNWVSPLPSLTYLPLFSKSERRLGIAVCRTREEAVSWFYLLS
uniref:KIAA0319 like n=1 Tax=Varanus komodoensis TaxID=61221 RepID=A0A8D2L445_VARKO